MLRLPSFSHDSTWLVRVYQHFERKCSHTTSPATLNLREEVSPETMITVYRMTGRQSAEKQ